MGDRIHIIPLNDAVPHDTGGLDCLCGPDVEYLEDGGSVVTHHSLDGREHSEPDHDRANCPLCSSQADG